MEKLEKGKNSLEVLPDLLAALIPRIPFPKRMRWGLGEFEFARPIQWLVALFGEAVIPLTVAGITSGNYIPRASLPLEGRCSHSPSVALRGRA